MESEGRRIHAQAAHAREEGDSVKSLQLDMEAFAAYQKEGDALGEAEILADGFLTLRHLYEKTDDRNYLIVAKYFAMASVEIAENSGNREALALPWFNLAKALETLGEIKEAVEDYRKALDNITNNPPTSHNRPGVVADFKVHLTTAEYKAGDKSALERALAALSELEQSDEVKYNKDVWLSGGHMRIAEMLKEDDPEKAKEHLQKAKEIIDANSDLKLRKAQWEKLAATF